jgi:hypothetical protein
MLAGKGQVVVGITTPVVLVLHLHVMPLTSKLVCRIGIRMIVGSSLFNSSCLVMNSLVLLMLYFYGMMDTMICSSIN